MENKKIWHDTIEKPIPNVDIYLSPSDNRPSCCMITTERTDLSMIPGQYAYISDLIATSKALDVAIGAFNFIGRPKANGEAAATARRTLKKISKIMKGA